MSTSIVLGYDGTEGGHAALEEALRVAEEIGGEIIAVYAYDKVISGGEARDLDEIIQARGDALLAEASARASEVGISCSTQYAEGRPAEALVAVADQRNARFIVIGSFGERPLKGALLGSTPYKLMQLSERPIIVVRAADPV